MALSVTLPAKHDAWFLSVIKGLEYVWKVEKSTPGGEVAKREVLPAMPTLDDPILAVPSLEAYNDLASFLAASNAPLTEALVANALASLTITYNALTDGVMVQGQNFAPGGGISDFGDFA